MIVQEALEDDADEVRAQLATLQAENDSVQVCKAIYVIHR
jgi:hypothetical protein